MTPIILRPYQQPTYDEVLETIPNYKRILVQAETGWGKSVLIGKLANNLPGRTLVLTHRIELLNQNSEFIQDCGILTAKVKKIQTLKDNSTVISMAQTCAARFKKYGADYVGEFDNIISDEVHMDFFKVVYEQLDFKTLIGLTATPIRNKTESDTFDGVEMVRRLSMAEDFDTLIQGVKTQELIELGFLTRDFNIRLEPPDLSKLVNSNSNPDGYTSKSLTEAFGSSTSIEIVYKGYLKYLEGKKTIIFNPTTAVNKKTFEFLSDKGLNVKMYDSVNKVEGQTRNGIVEWFKNTPDAILLNVGVFTTGFSVNDLEGIIYNKATKSLGLWLQSIGRGSRIVKPPQIKDKFIVLDCGLNTKKHGTWSQNRDWQKHFKQHEWKVKKETDLLSCWKCKKCEELNLAGTFFNQELERIECNFCGEPKQVSEPKLIKGEFVVLEVPDPPTAKQIVDYTLRLEQNANFAFKLLETRMIELFYLHIQEEDFFRRNKYRLKERYVQIYRPIYFAIIRHPQLKGGRKKLETQLNKVWDKIESLY